MEQPPDDDRVARIRQARQVLAGNEIIAPQNTAGRSEQRSTGLSGELRYFIALAAFVLVAAILYAVWGMAAATPVLVLLVAALLLAWFIL